MTKVCIFIVLLMALTPNIPAQSAAQTLLRSHIQPLIKDTMRQHQFPGIAIGIIKDGKVVYAEGFGVARLGSNELITPQSVFHTASVTKPFVATAIMQLAERDKINLDARVIEYLPYFGMKDERASMITVRQMLTHSSGMPDVEDYEWDKPQYDDKALERYVRGLSTRPLIGVPGEKYAYSNIAYEVLGDVIAKVSGMNFEDYVQRNILTPVGMKHSTLLIREVNPQRLVTPHVLDKASKVIISKVFPYNRPHAPSSTLYSTLDDMNRWAMANLNRGELGGKRILKAASYDLMWKPLVEAGNVPGYGVGFVGLSWFQLNHKGHRLVVHGGGDRGFQSFLGLAPDDSVAVVVLGNLSASEFHVSSVGLSALDMMLSKDMSR